MIAVNERVMPRVSHHLWSLLESEGIRFNEREREAYSLGKLAVLLELETMIRMIEDVRGMTLNDATRYTVSSALRSIQRSLQTSPSAIDDWYDTIIARFSADVVFADEIEPSSIADPDSTGPQPEDNVGLYLVDMRTSEQERDDSPLEPNELHL